MAGAPIQYTILMADDDKDDCMLVQEALEEAAMENQLFFVENGEDLLDYLYQQGKFSPPYNAPRPSLILLDLNMPKKDGREALKVIKEDSNLRSIPIVILTTSKRDEDIQYTYGLGASSFITKPVTFQRLVEVMKTLGHYWFGTVELPYK